MVFEDEETGIEGPLLSPSKEDEVGNYEDYEHEFDAQDIWGTQW